MLKALWPMFLTWVIILGLAVWAITYIVSRPIVTDHIVVTVYQDSTVVTGPANKPTFLRGNTDSTYIDKRVKP